MFIVKFPVIIVVVYVATSLVSKDEYIMQISDDARGSVLPLVSQSECTSYSRRTLLANLCTTSSITLAEFTSADRRKVLPT